MRIFLSFLLASLIAAVAQAHPDVAKLSIESFDSTNSQIEKIDNGIRWSINPGQSAELSLKPTDSIFNSLRYYDRIQFEFRIVSGEIDVLQLQALGHVSGPRQYKVHQWDIGQITTQKKVWHFRELNLARPNWMPWDEPDGQPVEGFFKFGVVGVSPDAVVEIRNIRLIRSVVYLKPFYELPVTWPVKSENADASITYKMHFRLLNMSNRPDDLCAEIQSKHQKFIVTLDHAKQSVKATKIAEFELSAAMSKADIDATPELYEEPLRVRFYAAHSPEADTVYETPLVRPLSKDIRRQVIVPRRDLDFILSKLALNDAKMKELVNLQGVVGAADSFCKIRLDHIPGHHGGPWNDWPRAPGTNNTLEAGTFMPEVVDPKTGFREVGTPLADAWWKEYLGYSGQMPVNLGMAYLLTRDEKYAKKGIELLELYGQQYGDLPWADPIYDPPFDAGPTVLCSSRIAACSTYGTNWNMKWFCKMISMIAESPSWTPEARERVYEGFVLPYATELAKFPGRIDNMTDITNANLLLLGLAFDDAHLVRWATKTDPGLITRLSDIDDDGISSEGRPLNYHYGAMAEYLPSIAWLDNSGLKIDYPKQKLLAALRMPYERATLDGYVPITGDNGRGWRVGPTALADEIVSIFPNEDWLYRIGDASTLSKKLWLYQQSNSPHATRARDSGWKDLLDPKPKLFKQAGLAILRTGDTIDNQIMLTFDFGRNPFHCGQDRGQITLHAFGQTFTQGPGSIYNAGTALPRNPNEKLATFCSKHSLAHNVIVVDQQDQLTAIGKLLAFSDEPEMQYCTAKIDGIRPGVSQTRSVVLTHGIIAIIDHVESNQEHTYDFVYHNLGGLILPSDGKTKQLDKPLGTTGNYENLVDPTSLSVPGDLNLKWRMSSAMLNLWHVHRSGDLYFAQTGMNDIHSDEIPNPAPTLIHRIRGKTADFVTVLEPYKTQPRVKAISLTGDELKIEADAPFSISISKLPGMGVSPMH